MERIANTQAHTFASRTKPTHKPKLAKKCAFCQRSTDREKGQQITAVWQNGSSSGKFNSSSSIELSCKTEHLCFDFRHFAKLQTVVRHFPKTTHIKNEFKIN